MKKINLIALLLIMSSLILSLGVCAKASEGTTPMYDVNGNVAYIPNSQLEAHHKIGWYYAPVMNMYCADGSSTVIAQSDYWTYKGWGWFEYPVTTVYNDLCEGKIIPKTEVAYWNGQGWYETNWRKAYADILYDMLKNGEDLSEPAFNFVYIDGDSIPELITRKGTWDFDGVRIYTYKNGVVYLQEGNGFSGEWGVGMFGEFGYIPGSGLFEDFDMSRGYIHYDVYQLSTYECQNIFSSESNFPGAIGTVYYKVNGKFVDEYTFEISDDKYTDESVAGFGSYYYDLNYSNIKAATWY